jgi:hypothetical protein
MKEQKMQKNKRATQQKGKRLFIPYALTTCALVLTGCAQTQPRVAVEQICKENLQKQDAMQIAEDVLRRMHFNIVKADTEQGLIRTEALPGAQSFELWRRDNVGAFNSTEANLHSIRRTAELSISQQGGRLCIRCDVKVRRLSLPEREVTTTAHTYEMFSPSHPSIQRLMLHPDQKKEMAWIDLGGDTQLAAEILNRISSVLDARRSTSGIENRESSNRI